MPDTPTMMLLKLLDAINAREEKTLHNAMAREINNHLYLRGNFGRAAELNDQDMSLIFSRFKLALTTIQPLEPGPDVYGKRNGGTQPKPNIDMAPKTVDMRDLLATPEAIKPA